MPARLRAMHPRQLLILTLALALLAFATAVAGDAGQWLFDFIKQHQRQLAAYADASPVSAALLYTGLFMLATSLSLPVATVLTIAAGAVFGFTEALLLTVFAGAAGATLAMLLSRHAFRAQVEARWPRWAARMDRGIARDGPFYLLSLRLSPVPPFFVVNAAMGLTRMPARTFFLVTLIGVAPLDAVFIQAGHMLGRMRSPDDALTLPMLATFALAGLTPLLLQALRRALRRRRREQQANTPR
jgi:uncharacterized membrane protein YdjX (TVP38/TMEM64 family)